MGSNGQTACLLEKRRIIDASACGVFLSAFFKVFPRLWLAEEQIEEERSGHELEGDRNDMGQTPA